MELKLLFGVRSVSVLTWVLSLHGIVSESQGQGAESRKGKRQCDPKSSWGLGAFLWDHPDKHRVRCMGRAGTHGIQAVAQDDIKEDPGYQAHSSTRRDALPPTSVSQAGRPGSWIP